MSADVVIRRARAEDFGAVHAFHRTLYLEHRTALTPSPFRDLTDPARLEAALADDARTLLRDLHGRVLLADLAGQPVGYVAGRIADTPRRILPRRGVIEDWFVVEGSRARGIGRALLAAILEVFREDGCALVESSTLPANTRARKLHETAGFSEVEIRYRMRLSPLTAPERR